MILPRDLGGVFVQLLGGGGGELFQGQQDAASHPGPEAGPIGCLQGAAEIHPGAGFPYVLRPEVYQFPGQQIFHIAGRAGEELMLPHIRFLSHRPDLYSSYAV